MNPYTQRLIERLDEKGIETSMIPGFVRSLANAVFSDPDLNLWMVSERLRFLGWDEFELDYHTLQLAVMSFEAEGLEGLETKPGYWFETRFMPVQAALKRGLAASEN